MKAMSVLFEEVKRQVRLLDVDERAVLVRELIEELGPDKNTNVERAWITESQRRLEAYENGAMRADDGEVVLARLHDCLR